MPANLEKIALYGIELWGYMGNKTSEPEAQTI